MKIVAISDIHGVLPEIPDADLLLISGDICPYEAANVQLRWLQTRFACWLKTIQCPVVGCAGNHDWPFQIYPGQVEEIGLDWHYLQDDFVRISDLLIYGTPWQLRFHDWAFNLDEPNLALKWAAIPQNTDILICHSPPFGYGDLNHKYIRCGSTSLTERILEIMPKLVVFGHVHEGYGEYNLNNIRLINAAMSQGYGKPRRDCVVIDL